MKVDSNVAISLKAKEAIKAVATIAVAATIIVEATITVVATTMVAVVEATAQTCHVYLTGASQFARKDYLSSVMSSNRC